MTGVDNAGGRSTKTVSYTVVGPPTVAIVSPSDGASYLIGSLVPVDYRCTSTVPQLNALTCIGTSPNGGTLDTSTVGAKTFTATATDALNLTTVRTNGYRVVYAFSGFASPVSSTSVLDGAKAGEPVPLKFSLNGNRGTNIVTAVSWRPTSCTDNSVSGSPATASGNLSYIAATDRYLEFVNTDKGWKGTCRTLTLQLADTTTHSVIVHFTS